MRTTRKLNAMELDEGGEILEVVSLMPVGTRVVLALLGLFPLLAPYELLIRPGWTDRSGPAFLFAAVVSAGAMAVSALCLFAALAGLSSRMRFDASRSAFLYSAWAPIVPLRPVQLPFDALVRIEVVVHEWSDGPDSYSLRVVAANGRRFDSASSPSRGDIDRYTEKIRAFVGLAAGSAS